MSLFKKITDYLRLIKFSHSVFALPFAFTSALIAANGIPTFSQIFWITVAMVGGRTGAMGMNRIIDRKIDALNPRTKNRELPRGVIKTGEAFIFTIIAFALLLFAGFDVFYAMQDIDFDKKHGLYSIPSAFGIKTSLRIARLFHLITIAMLLGLMPIFNLGVLYLFGVLIASALMLYEHS